MYRRRGHKNSWRRPPIVPQIKLPEQQLYKDNGIHLSIISECERKFIREWCHFRHIEESFIIVALTYWMRCKSNIAVNFLRFPESKVQYMVLCIHVSLKFGGYCEMYKCNFIKDLNDYYKHITPSKHQSMEMDILRSLNWEL